MSTSPTESPSQSFRVLSGVSRASIHWNIVGGNLNSHKKAHLCSPAEARSGTVRGEEFVPHHNHKPAASANYNDASRLRSGRCLAPLRWRQFLRTAHRHETRSRNLRSAFLLL